ncbi:hypothetical protein ACQ4PT_050341 [Festuca glaucescens]
MAQQVEKVAELQDPEIRAELDRLARKEGETVVKGGTGGKTLEAQERLAEGTYTEGGAARTTEPGSERAEEDGGVLIEPDEKLLEEVKKDLGRQ